MMEDMKLELESVCRVCLQEDGEMLHIFGAAGEETAISLKIAQCSPIKLVAGSNMPELICSPCYADLEMAYRFHTNCENSDAILKSFVQTAVLNEMVMQGKGPSCSDADREFDELIEEDHTTSDETIGDVVADIKPLLAELHQDVVVSKPSRTYRSESPSATMASSVIGDDAIIEDVKFDAVGRLKLKVLGEDQYVEYRMNVDDVDLLINDTSAIQVVTNTDSAATTSLNPLQFTYCEPIDDLIEESEMTANNSAAEDDAADNSDGQQQQKIMENELCDEDSPHEAQPPGELDETEEGCEIFPIMAVKTNNSRLNGRSRKPLADGGGVPKEPRRTAADKPMKKCEICGNEYKYQHALDGHMRRHRNEKPFRCDICGKAFVINFELSRHMRTHNGHKPYACKFCDRRFSDFGSRVKHTRTHTGERPYPCELCGKRFAYSHVLTNHMLTHTGVKRFSCETCDKRFSKSHHLKAHMNSHNRVRTQRGLMSGNRATATTTTTSNSSATAAATSAAYTSASHPRPNVAAGNNSPPTMSILGDAIPFDPSEFILPDDTDEYEYQAAEEEEEEEQQEEEEASSSAEADAVAAAALQFDNALLSMGMSGQIITDVETGEKFVLDLSDLEEDEKATVHLMHFSASDLGGGGGDDS